MLKSNYRLCHNQDFMEVFKKGKRHSLGGVLLYYKRNNLSDTRIGFVISKKYSLLAVKRNKQRRILQSAVQAIYPTIMPGFDIVLSYTNHNKVLSYEDAINILTELFKKTKLTYS